MILLNRAREGTQNVPNIHQAEALKQEGHLLLEELQLGAKPRVCTHVAFAKD